MNSVERKSNDTTKENEKKCSTTSGAECAIEQNETIRSSKRSDENHAGASTNNGEANSKAQENKKGDFEGNYFKNYFYSQGDYHKERMEEVKEMQQGQKLDEAKKPTA